MKKLYLVVVVLLLGTLVSAQTAKKIFEPVVITQSTVAQTEYTDAQPFETATIYMDCSEGGTAVISGSDTSTEPSLIIDNYLQVQTDTVSGTTTTNNYCPNIETGGCFDGVLTDPMNYLGQPASFAYKPVAEQSIAVAPEKALYTFRLMDWGYTYASSEVWLKTTCHIFDKVCHFDSGKKVFKTLMIDPNGVAAHVKQHGDYLGQCK